LRSLCSQQPAPGGASPAKTGTLQTRSVTAAQLATDTPVRSNGFGHGDGGHHASHWGATNGVDNRLESRPPPPPLAAANAHHPPSQVANTQNVGNLLHMAGTVRFYS